MKALDDARNRRKAKTAPPPSQVATPPQPTPQEWPSPPGNEAYHGLPGRIVAALLPHTEADPVALLIQVLIMFGNAVGRGPYFAIGGDRHYTHGFAVLVGPTGSGRKGTSAGMVKLVFDGLDDEWLTHRNVGGVSSGEGLLWAVRDPITTREKVNNGRSQAPTYEMVESDPGVVDKRLMVQEPEFANVLKQAERQGNTASAILRTLWDGLPVVQTLTKNNPAKATGAHVSLIGHITPEELHRYLTATETANGFANRFLFVCVKRSKLLPFGGRPAESTLAPLQAELRQAVAVARTAAEVTCHQSARPLWEAVYPILTGERVGLSGALSARAAPHVLRLSLLYALMNGSNVLRPAHLMAGVALWDYCERSALHLFGERTGNPVADEIRDLLRAAPGGLTRTELVAALGRHQFGDKLTGVLVALERVGMALRETTHTGGRPAERWFATCPHPGSSPLMATARQMLAATGDGDESDESPPTNSDTDGFHRIDRLCRTPVTDDIPPPTRPGQVDSKLMDELTRTGTTGPQLLAYLKASAGTNLANLTLKQLARALKHLATMPGFHHQR